MSVRRPCCVDGAGTEPSSEGGIMPSSAARPRMALVKTSVLPDPVPVVTTTSNSSPKNASRASIWWAYGGSKTPWLFSAKRVKTSATGPSSALLSPYRCAEGLYLGGLQGTLRNDGVRLRHGSPPLPNQARVADVVCSLEMTLMSLCN